MELAKKPKRTKINRSILMKVVADKIPYQHYPLLINKGFTGSLKGWEVNL